MESSYTKNTLDETMYKMKKVVENMNQTPHGQLPIYQQREISLESSRRQQNHYATQLCSLF